LWLFVFFVAIRFETAVHFTGTIQLPQKTQKDTKKEEENF